MVRIIFMVDDDLEDQEIFQEAIKKTFPLAHVLFARDGVEALEHLNSSVTLPDVIFLDYNMPRMNGVQCLKALKGEGKTCSIPVSCIQLPVIARTKRIYSTSERITI